MENTSVQLIETMGTWESVAFATLQTVGKKPIKNKGVSPKWKKAMLMAEHSPIRCIRFMLEIRNVKSWVSVHLVRHKIGIEHFVRSQREDRQGGTGAGGGETSNAGRGDVTRDECPQGARVNHTIVANAQAIINVSRKRLCRQAHRETRSVWKKVLWALIDTEPELVNMCVPDCIYRGHCAEMFPCGFADTETWKHDRERYLGMKNDKR